MWWQGGALALTVAGLALLRRHRRSAAVLLLAALAILGPELWSALRTPQLFAAGDRQVLRIAQVNLAEQNEHDPDMLPTVRGLDADVLVLCEYTWSWAERLRPLEADYPCHWLAESPPVPGVVSDGLRIAVFSRLAAAGAPETLNLDGHNAQLRVPLRFGERTFTLFAIHPWKPFPFGLFRIAVAERQELLDRLGRERPPLVVAGDFNASPRSAFMLRLRRLGLANASEVVSGRAPVTWPTYPAHLAPFRVAIDHVMYSAEFAAIGFDRAEATNSDHNAVVAELVWR